MSMATDLADAVVLSLSKIAQQANATIRRVAIPSFIEGDLTGMSLSVYPTGGTITDLTRGVQRHIITLEIAVQQAVPSGTTDETFVEECGAFVDTLISFCSKTSVTLGTQKVRPIAIRNEPIYAGNVLIKQRVFTSIVAIDYLVLRS